jgi:hypothetical protein
MLIAFNSLPESAKVWIYQSSKIMTDEQANSILKQAENFVDTWTAHQAGLKAGVCIFYNTFIVFGVDESYNDASGCSVDKKVHFVKSIEQQTGLNLFDRMNIATLTKNSDIKFFHFSNLNDELANHNLDMNSIVFNNLVSTVQEFNSNWQLPLKDSWMKGFVQSKTV